MNERPVLIVSGLGRCGTSMVMQLLDAGGIRCAGRAPAYEPERASPESFDPDFIASCAGGAVKLLDPYRVPVIQAPALVIWCRRDFMEQAKSQIKFVRLIFQIDVRSSAKEKMRKKLIEDHDKAWKWLSKMPERLAFMQVLFEDLIRDPVVAARAIGDFIRPHGFSLDDQAAATAVIPRTVRCLPGLLEIDQINRGGPQIVAVPK